MSIFVGIAGISANGFWARVVRAFKDNQMKIRTKEAERKKD